MSYGIREIHEDQNLVHLYYHIALRGARTSNVYRVEGLDTLDDLAEQRREPAKDVISIPLVDGDEKHMVQIGSNLDQVIKNQLTLFLQENADIFAWMPATCRALIPLR